MESSGPSGASWTILILPMTWPFYHSHEQMQDKTDLLNLVSAQTGININMSNTKIMKANTKSKNVVTVGGKPLEETDCFTYLGPYA